MAYTYTIERLLEIVGSADLQGETAAPVSGIASLLEAGSGELSFLGNPKYVQDVPQSNASVLLLPKDYEGEPKEGQLFVRLENPSFALALVCRDIEMSLLAKPEPGVHPSAVVHPSAQIADSAVVGPLCTVGEGSVVEDGVVLEAHVCVGRFAQISEGSYLFPRVVVADYCQIGARNRLLPGCVIGADGYGYAYIQGAHQRVPQIGIVETEADVDIGANTTVDRARFGSTRIGQGTKIDNQVQIGHNVRIGKHCLVVAQVGISGSASLGDLVIIGGQAGISGHLHVSDGAIIAGGSGVTRNVGAGDKVGGFPAESFMLINRIYVLQKKLPDLFKKFAQLEKTVKALAQTSSDPLK
ncbi:UDP-3-O-(3-hydroxymyristoyl)glucosamine N-acyltransferase [Coraliomargarita parva]|uniref:UDP-3-O-(3-hydroxymyristoyl)glucosamine N-acyltransferase n=1 Tax=Coraliomargarita parva TaxID=3014050 RepID=UPI0022B44152|nr:UDP-3-O-(3-hydroxymyristoyl)glucosamine N-acyltransferase [Coraliomargarita parva]